MATTYRKCLSLNNAECHIWYLQSKKCSIKLLYFNWKMLHPSNSFKSHGKQIEFIAFNIYLNKQASCERKLSLFKKPKLIHIFYELSQSILADV